MELESITPLLLTWNEEANLERTLAPLAWAREVVVIDSGSTDGTLEICARHPNVRVETRAFDSHSQQWNFGLARVRTPWVLALDADFVVSDSLPAELERIPPGTSVNGFRSAFRYCIHGTSLRGSLYPPRTVLLRKEACEFVQDGHTQLLVGDEPSAMLESTIDHDDRKPLRRWLSSQAGYASLEAEKLRSTDPDSMGLPDRLRKMIWPAAPATLVYTLFCKGTILDGWKGIFYALQRTYAELLLSLELLSRKIDSDSPGTRAHD